MAVIYHYDLGVNAIKAWYIFQVVVVHLSMVGVEVVMMARGESTLLRDWLPFQLTNLGSLCPLQSK
jgi:hypothetical protein